MELLIIVEKKSQKFVFSTRSTTQHINGNTDNKGRKKIISIFFSTRSTTQHIDGNTDNMGRTKSQIFFSTTSTTQQADRNISMEILIREEKKSQIFFFRQDRLPNISTEILIIRVEKKNSKICFFDEIDYPTDKHIDGNTDNKGRKKSLNFFSTRSTTQQAQTDKHIDGNTDKGRKKTPKFFFSTRSTTQQTSISTETLIIRVEK